MRGAVLCAHIIGCAPATSPAPIEVSLPAQHAASASPDAGSAAAARLPAWPTCARTVADKDWQKKAASTERCYFGILALGYLRDGYLRGLDGKSPGPALPTLPTAGRAPKGPLLPNMRLLQACPVAAAQNPDTAAMTEALMKANELREVAKLFNDAAAYYAEGEQEADGFAHAESCIPSSFPSSPRSTQLPRTCSAH